MPTTSARPEKGLWHYLGLTVSGALLLLVIALACAVIIIPKVSGSTALTVLTSSMKPGLPPGTLIIVRPVKVNDLSIGDIVTYQIHSGEPEVITHRIIAINASSNGDRTYTFKGDNNSIADAEPVIAKQIQGRLWYSVPWLGYVNNGVNGANKSWIIPVAAVGLLAYAGYMIASGLVGSVKKRRKPARPTVADESDGEPAPEPGVGLEPEPEPEPARL